MLKKLSVENYALIDQLELIFGKRLNIITGETGAGKSVLMGALGLLLGDRADTGALLDKNRKCIIRGEFVSNKSIVEFLKSADLDAEEELIIHREINKEGKSRSFVNETPVNLSLLKELGNLLVDIHSQHETLLLNKSNFQLSVVDAFCGHNPLIAEFAAEFSKYRNLKNELIKLESEEKQALSEKDYLLFQFNELHEASLIPDEQTSLEDELSLLSHAEEIKKITVRISDLISGSENNLSSGITECISMLTGLNKFTSEFSDSLNRLKALQIELLDTSNEIEKSSDKVGIDPYRLEQVNERLNLIYKLEQKHRIESVNGLIQLRNSLEDKLASFNSIEATLERKRNELNFLFAEIKKKAILISENRRKAIPGIESKIKKLLAELSMPEAVLKIEMNPKNENELNETGMDQIRFLFSANKGANLSDISKVASGGELSRLMLCLKASVARLIQLPTIVFDEIDTGVSGETAFKIGKVMQELAASHQLLTITHLPQIASRGEDHFFVYKEIGGKKTFTKVRKLSKDERIVEIARMLSGDKPTAIAMENAKELLKN